MRYRQALCVTALCIAGKHRLGVRVPTGVQPGMKLFYSTPYGTPVGVGVGMKLFYSTPYGTPVGVGVGMKLLHSTPYGTLQRCTREHHG